MTRAWLPLVLGGAAVAAAAAAWVWLSGAPSGVPHRAAAGLRSYLWAVLVWQAMMTAMMAPAVAPWVGAYSRLVGRPGAGASFAAGYFLAWLACSAALAGVQHVLGGIQHVHGVMVSPHAGGIVLVGAGLFQFAPIRAACLAHCRNPIGYLLARWRNGPVSGLRLGMAHGAYCIGCCWALMATAFAMGVMNLAWMATLTLAAAAEQIAPRGVWIGRAFGLGLVAWGLRLLFGPAS